MDMVVKPMTRMERNVQVQLQIMIGVQTNGVSWTKTIATSKPVRCRILRGPTIISPMRRVIPISMGIVGLVLASVKARMATVFVNVEPTK